MLGEIRVVLLAREPLLLSGRHDPAVLDDGGGAVVIEGRNPEDAHRLPALRSEYRVDEWSDYATLRQHDEAAEYEHHDEYRKQPEFLPFLHECQSSLVLRRLKWISVSLKLALAENG
jgi:hypothetical protein